PVLFETRWAMSYLRGPMTRDQIRDLQASQGPATVSGTPERARPAAVDSVPPIIPPGIDTWYVASSGAASAIHYGPALLAIINVHYHNRAHGVDEMRRLALVAQFMDGAQVVDWDAAEEAGFDAGRLRAEPESGATFERLPTDATRAANYGRWKKDVARAIRQQHPLLIHRHAGTKLSSTPGESEGELRNRVVQRMRETRDLEVAKLRKKFDARMRTLESRLERSQQAVEREQAQAKHKKLDTAVSFGTAILGAFLGRKRVSVTSASRVGTAVRKAGGIGKEARDVAHAEERLQTVQAELQKLQDELEDETAMLDSGVDPALIELEEVVIRPTSTNIDVELLGLVWLPYRTSVETSRPDW
ncbi:MAG TPA: ATP-binding protein, partial [Thermoanaerobaculia bacterium]|nr:ATP-binding protein [Thermoanaerobaculia bacterium]